MLTSTVIDLALGMIFCYASVALIASSIYEAFASWCELRSKSLLTGISQLLNAKTNAGAHLLLKIYNDAVAHPAGNGEAKTIKEIEHKPDYIAPENFARALTHAIQTTPGNFNNLKEDIAAIHDKQLRNALSALLHKAGGDLQKFQIEIANWFDSSMLRVSASYKKRAQIWCFIFALILVVGLNIDSVHLFQVLWQHPVALAEITTAPANSLTADLAFAQLQNLPIGWAPNFVWQDLLHPSLYVGWIITASASLFGAPFWFDLLKKVARLSPKTKPTSN